MQEKRQYRRFDFGGNVDLKIKGDRILHAYLDDIGLGGFRAFSENEIEANKNVGLSVMTQILDRPILGKGKIKHIDTIDKDGTRKFSIGVEFTNINKNKVRRLINETFGWRKKPFFSRQHRRELSLLLKLSPLLILITWPILMITSKIDYSLIESRRYSERLKEAAIYYLYH